MRRELRVVATEQVVGAAVRDLDGARLEGNAVNILRKQRLQRGDAAVIDDILGNGWSNGYVYFAEATE